MQRRIRVRTGVAAAAGAAMVLAGPVAGATADATNQSTQQAARLDVNVGGWAENLLVLPDGDILGSNLGKGRSQRIDATTHKISTVAEVAAPGGLALAGDTLYAVTGNSPDTDLTRKGGIVAIDLATGDQSTVTTGLGEANGLARLPGGDLVLTVTLGPGTGVHRVDPGTGERRLLTAAIPTPNGLAVGPDGQA